MIDIEEQRPLFDTHELYSSREQRPGLSGSSTSNDPRIFVGDVSAEHGRGLMETPFTIVGNDMFFKHLYEYQQGGGFTCILITHICYVLTVLFAITLSTFILTCVDWTSLMKREHTDISEAIYPMCRPPNGRNGFLTFTFIIFIIWWSVVTYRTFRYIHRMWKIRDIWTGILGLSSDVKWVTWQMVIDRYHERVDNSADSNYMVNRIMRWDNYLIAILTMDVLGFRRFAPLIFTKVFEWNLEMSIRWALFREDDIPIKDILNKDQREEYVERLRKTFMMFGVLNIIFFPFVFSALTVYFVYRYVSEFQHNPKAMGLYSFTPFAKWKLRDFNELDHVYRTRMTRAHPKIIEYLAQFVDEVSNIIFKFLSFVIGVILSILLVVSFYNPDIIISLFITEKPIIFYVGTLGALLLWIQNSTVDEPIVYEPDEKFDELVKMLHCMPTTWATMSTRDRYMEIRKLFRYKWVVFVQEIFSVVYVPFIFIFWMPMRCYEIVNFFKDNSVNMEKLDIICSCAVFDVHQPIIHTMHEDDNISITSSLERKMSSSVLNFREAYPTWDPVRFRRNYISRLRSKNDSSLSNALDAQRTGERDETTVKMTNEEQDDEQNELDELSDKRNIEEDSRNIFSNSLGESFNILDGSFIDNRKGKGRQVSSYGSIGSSRRSSTTGKMRDDKFEECQHMNLPFPLTYDECEQKDNDAESSTSLHSYRS